MNFFQKLFGGQVENPEDTKKEQEAHDFEVLKYDGVRAMKVGETDYAVRCFNHALEIKDDLEIHDYLSQVFIQTGDLVSATGELRMLAEAQPDNIRVFIRQAHVAYMMEDYDAMEEACEQALAIDGESAVAHFLYARSYKGKDDLVKAVDEATRAIELDGTLVDTRLFRAEALMEGGRLQEAGQDADWLLEHAAGDEDVLLMKARLETKKKSYHAAADYYNKVIEADPFHAVAFKERADVRRQIGDATGADEDAAKAAELAPEVHETSERAENGDGQDIQRRVEQKYKDNNPYGF